MDTNPNPSRKHRLIAACSGALLTSLSVTPLDVVKTRMQTLSSSSALSSVCSTCEVGPFKIFTGLNDGELWCYRCKSYSKPLNLPKPPNTTLGMFTQIIRNEGGWRLWRGLTPTLAMSVPSTVLYFNSYDELSTILHQHQVLPPSIIPLVAGISSRSFAATIVSPIELIRTRAMARNDSNNVIASISKELYKETKLSGIKTLFRGLAPTLWRDVPFSGVYWSCYEFLKHRLGVADPSSNTFFVSFVSGASSGMLASLLTHPMDVIKTRQQIEIMVPGTQSFISSSNSLRNIVTIYQNEGISALYVGVPARIAKVAPACAIMISSYEVLKQYFVSV